MERWNIYNIYRYVRHIFVARSWVEVMWEELAKCQPFLKHSNHWKRSLKMIFKGSVCFQFPEAALISTAKESLRSTERGSLQVLAVLYELKVPSRMCHVQL